MNIDINSLKQSLLQLKQSLQQLDEHIKQWQRAQSEAESSYRQAVLRVGGLALVTTIGSMIFLSRSSLDTAGDS
jgi:hypothetical protein